MEGGKGNDTYIVDDTNDVIVEALTQAQGGGIDTVKSSATYYLAQNIENLILTDGSLDGGIGYISGFGNGENNNITGNQSNNTLHGGDGNDILIGNGGNDYLVGGLGNDTLIGGTGREAYEFSGPLTLDNVDTIQGFNTREGDHLHLSYDTFSAIGEFGYVNADKFRLGTIALDNNDYFIFNKTNGYLYYDVDGSGSIAQSLFAIVNNISGEFSEKNLEIINIGV